MPDDATNLHPIRPVSAGLVRTIFSTSDAFSAGLAGFDGACEPGVDGGFSVVLDTRGGVPSVEIVLSDGQVCGIAAIKQLTDALLSAEQMIGRLGRAA